MSEVVKAVQVKTEAAAHIVIRNGAGKKLFDIDLSGVSITVTVPSDAEIRVEPTLNRSQETRSGC